MARALLMAMPDIYQSWNPTLIVGPWVGGASLSANSPNHDVYVADLILKRRDVRAGIREAIERTNPQVVGLNAMTFQYPTAVRVARYVKNEFGLEVAFGGYHATAMREEIASSPEGEAFDYIFAGESELTFNKFLDLLDMREREKFWEISGLSFRDNGKWFHNKRHPALSISPGLASILPPKRESRIWTGFHFYDVPFDTAESSRGCDFSCEFCSMRGMQLDQKEGETLVARAGFKQYPLERVISDLKAAYKLGTRAVFLPDDNPAMHPDEFKELLRAIIKSGLSDIRYSGMVSTAGMADRRTTRLMREAGWDFSFLGVENIYEGNLKAMGTKKTTADLAARAIENLHQDGIVVLAGIIAGSPDDTEEVIRANFRWFYDHPVDGVMCQFLTPYPGTPLRGKLLEDGLVENPGGMDNNYGGWSTYNGEFAHCRTRSGLTPEQIETIAYEEQQKLNAKRGEETL